MGRRGRKKKIMEKIDFTQDSEYKKLMEKRPPPLAAMTPFEDKPKKVGNPNFKKGMKPLNPNGRPRGSVNKYTALSRELMNENAVEIVAVVVQKAKEGDVHCLKMCLDRILPVHKAVDSTRNKSDAQVIINVASIESIQQKASEYDEAELVDPVEKSDDEVIVNVASNG